VRLLDALSPEIPPTAAMLERFSPAQLLGFARRLDRGLEGRDFADAGQRLDQLRAFAAIGLGREDVAIIRERFTAWPRTAEAAGRALEAELPESTPRGYPQLRADCDAAQEDPITSSSTNGSREDPEAGR
jgi:hypothetical protein